jgi:L-seryl-tRNA(Ser) seleniumtransferase
VECLIQTQHRFTYDRAYRAAGMTIVESDTKQGLIEKISDKTAMIAVLGLVDRQLEPTPGTLMPEELIEIGKKHGVPVLVNAASEVPPPDVLTRYTKAGADLVLISGGKGLMGPQSSGILAGRKDLIEAARLNHSPYNSVGRGMKVDRHEIVGLVAAVKRYVTLDHELMIEGLNRKARYIADTLNEIPSVKAELIAKINNYGKYLGQGFNNVYFRWDPAVIPLTGGEAAAQLRTGEPSILIYSGGKMPEASLTPQCMQDGEELLAAQVLEKFFRGKMKRA